MSMSMGTITAGIDCGARVTKALLWQDGKVLAKGTAITGFDQGKSAEQALKQALEQAGLSQDQIRHITATGIGRSIVPLAHSEVTEVTADAKAVVSLIPEARTIIDVGAEEGRAIRCESDGRVKDFAVNEKCAAGAGTFVETMARTLELKLEEIGPLSLKSKQAIPMNAQCAVFAESEVVSLIHQGVAKEDIIRAVHEAMADRVAAMVRRAGLEPVVVLVGGVAHDVGFLYALQNELGVEVKVPENPEFIGALGAAMIAADRSTDRGAD